MARHCNNHQARTTLQMSCTDRPASISARSLQSSARGQCKYHPRTNNQQYWRIADLDRSCSANTRIRLLMPSTLRPLCMLSLETWCSDPALGNLVHPQNPTDPSVLRVHEQLLQPLALQPLALQVLRREMRLAPLSLRAPRQTLLAPRQALLALCRALLAPDRALFAQHLALLVLRRAHLAPLPQGPVQEVARWVRLGAAAHTGGPQPAVQRSAGPG